MAGNKDVRSALYAKLTGDATLTAAVGSRVYYEVAPASATYPLIIFAKVSRVVPRVMTGQAYSDALWLVKGVDKASSANAVDDIASRIETILDDGSLTIAGQQVMAILHDSDVQYSEVTEGVTYHHSGARYRLRYQPT